MSTQLHRFSSSSFEYGTPARWVEAVRQVMGGIDLDPASSATFNNLIGAARFMNKEFNALRPEVEWTGRVFLNPPFTRSGLHQRFITRLIDQYRRGLVTQSMLLVNAETGSTWFKPLWAYPMCFAYARIAFDLIMDGQRVTQASPTHNNVLVYLPPQAERDGFVMPIRGVTEYLVHFETVCGELGEIVAPPVWEWRD